MDRIVILIYLISLYAFISYAGMGEATDDEFLPPAEFD